MNATELFAHNLRNVLYEKGKTQAELAKGVNTSQTSVSQWVNAVVMPRPYMVDRICKYLGCTFEDLTADHTKTATLAPSDIIADTIIERPILMSLFLVASKASDEKIQECIEVLKK